MKTNLKLANFFDECFFFVRFLYTGIIQRSKFPIASITAGETKLVLTPKNQEIYIKDRRYSNTKSMNLTWSSP